MATNVKILLRRGLRSDITADTLDAGELGYAEDTRQLYVGVKSNSSIPVDEIIFDPFTHAQSIVQTYLNLPVVSGGPTEQGREIDEDLIIRNVSDVPVLLNDMATYGIITAGAFEPTVSVTAGAFRPISTDTAEFFVIGREYTIATAGTTDFTLIGAADSVVGTVFTATGLGTGTGTATYGTSYTIATVDDGLGGATTDFTLIGAADNNIGTVFKATGIGAGTGSATYGKEYKIKTTGTTDYVAIGSSVLTSGNFVVGTEYTILTSGTSDFRFAGATDSNVDRTFVATGNGTETYSGGSFVIGREYTILTTGTTDFTLIGATDSNIGTVFTATGVGTGTGTANFVGTGTALLSKFVATGVGSGTGTAIDIEDHFYANIFASERKNVEVLTENSFSQVYANMYLQSNTSTDGRRPDLFKKDLATTSGTFLKYAKTDATSFFIDYSLKQVGTSPAITFVRVGRIQVINGAAVIPAIAQAKLTDTNTEIWQDDGDSIAQSDEFSNIVFTAVIDGNNMKINYTQDANFTTEISYTVKRWKM